MTESRDLAFLINSPKYRKNATFVTACYKEMLDRDVDAEELFMWCRQLDGVYSRESLIAALSGSVKFGDRFEIKDLDRYKKRAFIPRAMQYVINKLSNNVNGYDKGCIGPLLQYELKFDFPQYGKRSHNWSDEIDMLSLCQIETLGDRIRELGDQFGNIEGVGDIAQELTEGSEGSYDTTFVTAVDRIVNLIKGEDTDLVRSKNLIIPIPVPSQRGIEVIFDENWSARVKGNAPRRWLVGRGSGDILILNNHEYPVTVKLTFEQMVLNKGALVRLTQGQNSRLVSMDKKAVHITLETVLLPGENRLGFQYIGTSDEAEEITNIAVSKLTIDGAAIDMSCDMKLLGAGYYSAVFPDCRVRNVLHSLGYSEIECTRLYRDNSIQREETTRFLQHDPNSSGDSFFVLKNGEKADNSVPSVRLYIAKKTGEID